MWVILGLWWKDWTIPGSSILSLRFTVIVTCVTYITVTTGTHFLPRWAIIIRYTGMCLCYVRLISKLYIWRGKLSGFILCLHYSWGNKNANMFQEFVVCCIFETLYPVVKWYNCCQCLIVLSFNAWNLYILKSCCNSFECIIWTVEFNKCMV